MNCIAFLTTATPRRLDWLERALGFERSSVHDSPDGRIAHAELKFGGGMVMLGTGRNNDFGLRTPRELGAVSQGVYLSSTRIDAHHERAVAGGAEIVRELHDTDYGSRDYMVRDPEGNLWSIGTYRPE